MRQIFVCSPPEKEARVFVRSSSEKPRPVNALANRVSKSYRARSYWASSASVSSCRAFLRTYCSTVSSGFSTAAWVRNPVVSFRLVVRPDFGFFSLGSSESLPVRTSRRVVFPAPFLPTMAMFSVPRTAKSKCERMTVPPRLAVPSVISSSIVFPQQLPV